MDIASSASAVVGLVFSFAKVIKTCNDIRSRYKDAGRTVDSIRHELETLQGALQELANLMIHDASALSSRRDESVTLPATFKRTLAGFQMIITSLQNEFQPLRSPTHVLGRSEKVKLLWSDDGMRNHKDQLRGQGNALNLLLQVLQTEKMSDMKNNLQAVEIALTNLSFAANPKPAATPLYGSRENNEMHILDEQGDLMEFDLLDEAQQWSALEVPRKSIHLEIFESLKDLSLLGLLQILKVMFLPDRTLLVPLRQ
ncbi:hypothetical protein EG329_009726 [Mollisiaceae sp. DMI_Dod_QoI]|nr:hypothetical protein EG329_009726 [Helotiales sp. DMI_Dod_QoI]